jgi:hypothetical protein
MKLAPAAPEVAPYHPPSLDPFRFLALVIMFATMLLAFVFMFVVRVTMFAVVFRRAGILLLPSRRVGGLLAVTELTSLTDHVDFVLKVAGDNFFSSPCTRRRTVLCIHEMYCTKSSAERTRSHLLMLDSNMRR